MDSYSFRLECESGVLEKQIGGRRKRRENRRLPTSFRLIWVLFLLLFHNNIWLFHLFNRRPLVIIYNFKATFDYDFSP
eukprot:c31969_g1_i1 orf=299-532(+)